MVEEAHDGHSNAHRAGNQAVRRATVLEPGYEARRRSQQIGQERWLHRSVQSNRRTTMSVDHKPTAFGRIVAPRQDWLARAPVEKILEPELAIVDTHHHLWSERGRYLVEELLADTGTGHNVEATVFIECRTNYRTAGPIEMRSVGEVEFVANLAAQCDAEHRGKTRVAAGIVGFADLTLGDRVEPILAALVAAGKGRFRGVPIMRVG